MTAVINALPMILTSLATFIVTLRGHQVYLRKRDQGYPQCPMCGRSIRPPKE